MCYGYGDLYFAAVVVAGCGSKDCYELIRACITYRSGCICILDAPCTDGAYRKLENRYKVAIGCILCANDYIFIICGRYGYGNGLFCCEVVVTFLEAEGYGVFACINNLFYNFSILGDHYGKCCTVRCGNACDGVFLGIVYLGIILRSVDVYTCLCNTKADCCALCTDQVFITLCNCLNVVRACCRRNGCGVLTVDLGCIYVSYGACEVGLGCGCVCLRSIRPTVDCKIGNYDLCLYYLIGQLYVFGCIRCIPLVVVLIDQAECYSIGSYAGAAVVGYVVFTCTYKTGGQVGAGVYLLKLGVGDLGNGDCLLFNAEVTRCYQILIVGIGCGESCYIRACIRRNGRAVCAVICGCQLIFNGNGSCKSLCCSCISCFTVYPRIDAGCCSPLVVCCYDSIGECLICIGTVGPYVVAVCKCYRYGIGAYVDAAVIGYCVSLCCKQTGCQGCACVDLVTVCCRDRGCIDTFLCYGYGDLYLAAVVVAGGGGVNRYELLGACVANCGCGIDILDAPCSFYTCGKNDLFKYEVAVGCCLRKNHVFDIGRLCNRYRGCNHRFVVVSCFGKRNGDGINTCIGERCNCLTVLLVNKYQFALGVRTCNGIQYKCIAVINEVVAFIYIINTCGCFCYFDFKLACYRVVVDGIFGRVESSKAMGSCCGDFCCQQICPAISCRKLHVGKRKRFRPDCRQHLVEVCYGINLIDGKRNYLGCRIVCILQGQRDLINACILLRGVTENNKIINLAVRIFYNVRNRVFDATVVIKSCAAHDLDDHLLGGNCDFNRSFDNVISAIGGGKHSDVCLLANRADKIFGTLPSPFSVRVSTECDRADQIAVCNGSCAERGICDVEGCGVDGKCTLLNLKHDVGVGCGCGQRIDANACSNVLGIGDGKTNQLEIIKSRNFVFNGGKCLVGEDGVTVDLNGYLSRFDFVSANECTLIVGIVNFEIVVVRACIGVICSGVFVEDDVDGSVRFVGRQLTGTVVDKAIYDFGEGDFLLFNIYGNGVGCKNLACFVCNEADGEDLLAGITDGAFCIVELPCTYNSIRELDALERVAIGRFNLGDRRDLRGVACGKGHVVGEDIGNIRRPAFKDVARLFGCYDLFHIGNIQEMEGLEYFAIDLKLYLIHDNYGNVEALSRIVEFEQLATDFGRVNVRGYHRKIDGNLGCCSVHIGTRKCDTAQIHRFAVRGNSVEITQVQLVACAIVTCFVSASGHHKDACKQCGNNSDTNDYSNDNLSFHKFLLWKM